MSDLEALAAKNSGTLYAIMKGSTVYASDSYVLYSDLLNDAGVSWNEGESAYFTEKTGYAEFASGNDATVYFSKRGLYEPTYEEYSVARYYYPNYSTTEADSIDNGAIESPMALALSYKSGKFEGYAKDAVLGDVTNTFVNMLGQTDLNTQTDGFHFGTGLTGIILKVSSLNNAVVSGVSDAKYTGKAIKPAVKVAMPDGTQLTEGTDYAVSYGKNTNVKDGGTVTIAGKGAYEGQKKVVSFKIKQASNSMASTVSLNAKAGQKLTVPATFGTAKVAKVVTADKKGVLSVKDGKIVVKKGAKKGTYTIKVKTKKIAATKNYKGVKAKAVTVKVAVK
jgi:hypothetical protein